MKIRREQLQHQQQFRLILMNVCKFHLKQMQKFFLKQFQVLICKELIMELLRHLLQLKLNLNYVLLYNLRPMLQLPLHLGQILQGILQEHLRLQNSQLLKLKKLNVWQQLLKRMLLLFYKIYFILRVI